MKNFTIIDFIIKAYRKLSVVNEFRLNFIYHFNYEYKFTTFILKFLLVFINLIIVFFLFFFIYFVFFIENYFFNNLNFYFKLKKNIRPNKKNLHVIGNRMKLNNRLVKKNDDLFCVNHFYINNKRTLAKFKKQIKYYIQIHRPNEYFKKRKNQKAYLKKYFFGFVEYIKKNPNICFLLAKDWQNVKELMNCKNIIYFNMSGLNLFYHSVRMLDKINLVPSATNILQICIFLGIKIGYKKIFLHGYDLNFNLYKSYKYAYSKNNMSLKKEEFSGKNFFFTDLKTRDWNSVIQYAKFKKVKIVKDKKTTFFPLIK